MAEKQQVSVNLPPGLVERVDAFCDARVLGRAKFVEIACERLLSTAPTLPGTVEHVHDGEGRLVTTYAYGEVPLDVEDEGPGTVFPQGRPGEVFDAMMSRPIRADEVGS